MTFRWTPATVAARLGQTSCVFPAFRWPATIPSECKLRAARLSQPEIVLGSDSMSCPRLVVGASTPALFATLEPGNLIPVEDGGARLRHRNGEAYPTNRNTAKCLFGKGGNADAAAEERFPGRTIFPPCH